MLRLAGKEDFVEDLYLSIRELVEHHGCQPREIRRFVNQALKNTPPKLISNRLNFAQDESGGRPVSDDQGRLFDPERFSPLHLSVWIEVPSSMARTLAIASAIGRSIRTDSTFAPLRHGKDVIGVYLGPPQIRTVLKIVGSTPERKYWQHFVADCERLKIAHRCGRGAVTLFVALSQNTCPNPACDADLSAGGDRFEHQKVTDMNTKGDRFEHQGVRDSGDAIRDERGDGESVENKRPAVTYGWDESMCVCGHGFTMHFIGGTCRRPSCDCQKPRRLEQEDQDAIRLA